ncbi:DUF1614 domain-containing protein [Methanolobus halotolerans]|uniref:DUF1614 domain-containing protein n=1 Tax=Methanolobus halotolerans TaxID=2052935 RepID=A0A4E0Q2A8_9EURY|nr:DUF1614 domain-containing protein [Methanolobus halotolerans]TGC06774.1 hypothetical protein CUN85_12490 [Methanolobus halotolerans]
MRGYINRSEIRMYAAFTLILLPIAVLCYNGNLSIGTITAFPLLLILVLMFAGSLVEIPVLKTRTKKSEQLFRFAPLIEDIYSVPVVKELHTGKERVFDTTITLNLGGFLVPLVAIVYLFLTQSNITALEVMLIIVVAVTFLSEMVNGVGIIVPQYIGIIAIPFSLLTAPQNVGSVTFIAGIGGILLGTIASIIAFNKENSGSAYISIGGAGNFKAIYITALLASLLSYFV